MDKPTESARPWSAPQAVEVAPFPLPEEITVEGILKRATDSFLDIVENPHSS